MCVTDHHDMTLTVIQPQYNQPTICTHLKTLKKNGWGKHCGKGEIAENEEFHQFPQLSSGKGSSQMVLAWLFLSKILVCCHSLIIVFVVMVLKVKHQIFFCLFWKDSLFKFATCYGNDLQIYVTFLCSPHFTCVFLILRHFLWFQGHLPRSNIKVTLKNKRAKMALYRSTGWYLGICLKHKTLKKD